MKSYLLLLFISFAQFALAQTVVINEFVASNDSLSGIADELGEYDDWIELYNNSSDAIDLSGYYLSDNFETPDKWQIPDGISIAGNGFLIIWADDDDEQGALHTNYKLNKQGEEILLSDPNLNLLDSISYSDQETNVSMARIPNGTGAFVPRAPTFNTDNDGGVAAQELVVRKDFRLYPNPAEYNLTLDFSSAEGILPAHGLLKITDALGRTLLVENMDQFSELFSIDVSRLATGSYFVHLKSDQYLFIKQFSIQRND